jgi:hypothetical protein
MQDCVDLATKNEKPKTKNQPKMFWRLFKNHSGKERDDFGS